MKKYRFKITDKGYEIEEKFLWWWRPSTQRTMVSYQKESGITIRYVHFIYATEAMAKSGLDRIKLPIIKYRGTTLVPVLGTTDETSHKTIWVDISRRSFGGKYRYYRTIEAAKAAIDLTKKPIKVTYKYL